VKKSLAFVVFSLMARVCFAADMAPPCVFNDEELPVDNQSVIELENNSDNGYKTQVHVTGIISKFYGRQNGHVHFAIQFDDQAEGGEDGIEIVHSTAFGKLPYLNEGMPVEVCGEYITSNEYDGRYEPSPMGAIIHWTHASTNEHPSGFLMIDQQVYGQDIPERNSHSSKRRRANRNQTGRPRPQKQDDPSDIFGGIFGW
jgi:hypothetical protein